MMPRLRPFGVAESDLAVDFGAQNRAALVTRLLAQCTADPAEAPDRLFREISAGKRLEYLLVLAAGGTDDALSLPCKCETCREDLELELTLGELAALQRDADAIETVGVEIGGEQVTLRKPLGGDLEAWGEMVFSDARAAAAGMIERLTVDRGAADISTRESIEAIEAAFDEADPLIDFRCDVRCGACGGSNEVRVDLMETALGMLKRVQHQLIVALHRLASHYHWNEQEILAVPEWRREHYLQLIASSDK